MYHFILHCDFEYSEQPESPEDGQPKRSSLWLEVCPDHLKYAARDDEAIEAIEGRLEVNPGTQGPHPQEHFKNEQTQEHVLGNVCKQKRWN